MSTESIKQRIQIIKDIGDEVRKVKALYDESLENDALYADIQDEAAKHREEVKVRKAKVLSQPEFVEFDEHLKELKEDLKENREILSQELADYYKESGSQEIIDANGNKKRMKFSVKLINSAD